MTESSSTNNNSNKNLVINMKRNFSRPEGKLSVYDTLMKLMKVSDGSIRKANTDGLDCKPFLKPHF